MARAKKATAASSHMIPTMLRVLAELGMPMADSLRVLRLPRGAEKRDEIAVAPDDFEKLLAHAARVTKDPSLALRLPSLMITTRYNIGELAARSSPTLREAFDCVARYASLFYAHLIYECRDRGDTFVVAQRMRSGTRGGRFGNEFALASCLEHARRMSNDRVAPIRVMFAHAASSNVEETKRHFGTNDIAFDRAENTLVFARHDVDRSVATHDARLLATADRLATSALGAQTEDFVSTVEARLREALPSGRASAAFVARAMGLSTRTLQRRLDEEGATFSELVMRARKDIALEAIRDASLTIAAVAERAGFADAATFSRAFKRWTGKSPGAYRS